MSSQFHFIGDTALASLKVRNPLPAEAGAELTASLSLGPCVCTDEITDGTTSHSTKRANNARQVAGYSHSTKHNEAVQVAGYVFVARSSPPCFTFKMKLESDHRLQNTASP